MRFFTDIERESLGVICPRVFVANQGLWVGVLDSRSCVSWRG
jgi:hypothetical protein